MLFPTRMRYTATFWLSCQNSLNIYIYFRNKAWRQDLTLRMFSLRMIQSAMVAGITSATVLLSRTLVARLQNTIVKRLLTYSNSKQQTIATTSACCSALVDLQKFYTLKSSCTFHLKPVKVRIWVYYLILHNLLPCSYGWTCYWYIQGIFQVTLHLILPIC